MDESGNQLDAEEQIEIDERIPEQVSKQLEIDELNMKDLNEANRLYRKCVAGKCPPPLERSTKNAIKVPTKPKKPKNFTSPKLQDRKLSQIWLGNGRSQRINMLEQELEDVNTMIAVAAGKTHIVEQEKNFAAVRKSIDGMAEMKALIYKSKTHVSHLESQVVRFDLKQEELRQETESEGKILNHALSDISQRLLQQINS